MQFKLITAVIVLLLVVRAMVSNFGRLSCACKSVAYLVKRVGWYNRWYLLRVDLVISIGNV